MIVILFTLALAATFLLGWLGMIIFIATTAAVTGKPVKTAIQPLLDEW